MGERQRTQRAASATRRLPLCAATLRAIPPPTLPRFGGGECRDAVAHRRVRLVSSPSCEGKLPLRSLPPRFLREGRRSRRRSGGASMADPRRGGRWWRAPPLREAALRRLPAPPSRPLATKLLPLRRPTFVGGTRQAWQRSAQFGAAVSAVAGRRLVRANSASGVATPQPRCEHQQQRGATHAARQAMVGGARKATVGSAPEVACRAILVGLPCVGSNKL